MIPQPKTFSYSSTLENWLHPKPPPSQVESHLKRIIDGALGILKFTMVDHKENFDIYAAHIAGSIAGSQRFVILYVIPESISLDPRVSKLSSQLPWVSIATRSIKLTIGSGWNDLPIQRWRPDIMGPAAKIALDIVDRQDSHSTYKTQGMEIVMLHDQKKKTRYQYGNKILLLPALETFDTICKLI